VPAELSRFVTTEWVDGDDRLSDYARFYEIYCGVLRRAPGFESIWDAEGRKLVQKLPAPRPRPASPIPKAKPDDFPSIDCGRAREWQRVQMTYPAEQHQITVIAAAEDEGHHHFIHRIRRRLEANPSPAIKLVDWSPRPLTRGDYLERLLRGLTDDERAVVEDLPALLREMLSERNVMVIHPLLDTRHEDPRLLDYYTKWLPEQLAAAQPSFRLKCIQPVAWRRAEGVRSLAGRLVGAMRRNVPDWLSGAEERKARELISRIATPNPLADAPVPPVFLSAIDESDVEEFCINKRLRQADRDALLARTRRGETIHSSSDILCAIDDYMLGLRSQVAAQGAQT
jgi:hypothetical protein